MNTSDPALHQEGVGTSDDAAHDGTPPCTGSALPYEPYVFWRFRYYVAHGGMSYRDIDLAVDRGELKQGDMPNISICVTTTAPAHAGAVATSVKPVVGNSGISRKSLNILAADDYEEYGDDPV